MFNNRRVVLLSNHWGNELNKTRCFRTCFFVKLILTMHSDVYYSVHTIPFTMTVEVLVVIYSCLHLTLSDLWHWNGIFSTSFTASVLSAGAKLTRIETEYQYQTKQACASPFKDFIGRAFGKAYYHVYMLSVNQR